MEYQILLPNSKEKFYRTLSFFILVLNAAMFTYIYLDPKNKNAEATSILGLLMTGLYIFLYFASTYFKSLKRKKLEYSFFILAMVWMVAGYVFFALIMLVIAIAGFYASSQTKIIFSREQVVYPSLFSKSVSWHNLSNVMLKDDVLTVDFKNNKLFQSNIHPDSAASIDPARFNYFCAQRIRLAEESSPEPVISTSKSYS